MMSNFLTVDAELTQSVPFQNRKYHRRPAPVQSAGTHDTKDQMPSSSASPVAEVEPWQHIIAIKRKKECINKLLFLRLDSRKTKKPGQKIHKKRKENQN